jgi:hypothetical protein
MTPPLHERLAAIIGDDPAKLIAVMRLIDEEVSGMRGRVLEQWMKWAHEQGWGDRMGREFNEVREMSEEVKRTA